MDSPPSPLDLSLTDPETLETLLQSSKTLESRSHLAATLPLPFLLRHLSPSNIRLLRLLRDLCAGDLSVQTSFIRANGPDLLASALFVPPPAPPQVLKVGLQVLGNVAMAGEEHRAAVWARMFPIGFGEVARVREAGVCDVLCMVLDTCCSEEGGRGRLRELVADEIGLGILVEVTKTASSVGYQEEWLEWLLTKICIEESYLSKLFAKVGSSHVSDGSDGSESQKINFTVEQAFLLCLLSRCLAERPCEVIVSNSFALQVLNIMKEASGTVDFSSKGSSKLPTGSPAIDVLGYSLVLLRDICAWDGSPNTELPVSSLLSAGIVELVLSLLCELEPPSIVKKAIEHANKQGKLLDIPNAIKVCPYKGYRRDVVSIICNCLRGKKEVQDEIRQRNGILLLLQQCVIDEDNPFLREWGMLTVSSLLEGNMDNQHEVAALKLQEPVQTPEIAELGLKVEVDEKSARARLVNM